MSDTFTEKRKEMVRIIAAYGVQDQRILSAMQKIRRHKFIPPLYLMSTEAYGDHPCAIGYAQTISQPYIVALTLEMARLKVGERVLEVGCGCGYVAAVLAELGMQVFALERIQGLAEHARATLQQEGYGERVTMRLADGHDGWQDAAPFDAILVSCAAEERPTQLAEQLADGGRLIAPVGKSTQYLDICTRNGDTMTWKRGIGVRFVPMLTGVAKDNI